MSDSAKPNELFQQASALTKAEVWDRYSISVIRALTQASPPPVEYPLNAATVKLLGINSVLWDLEDDIRKAHIDGDDAKVKLYSRMIIELNRRRAAVKAEITNMEGERQEEKKYAGGL